MKTLYIDMDNVIVDFASGIVQLDEAKLESYKSKLDEVPGIFSKMKPMPGAVGAVKKLWKHFGDYIIDDRLKNGVDKFDGKHIHFGTEEFTDWESVLKFLCGGER